MSYQQAAKEAREERVLEQITGRIRKLEAAVGHAIEQTTELRARLLGEREPAQLKQPGDDRPVVFSCAVDDLRNAITAVESLIENLHGHLSSLGRL